VHLAKYRYVSKVIKLAFPAKKVPIWIYQTCYHQVQGIKDVHLITTQKCHLRPSVLDLWTRNGTDDSIS